MQSGNDTEALATFAAMLRFDDLPAEVVATVKRMILDSLGTALAATTLGDGCAESVAVMHRPCGSHLPAGAPGDGGGRRRQDGP
jgi:2-methylcitrate dehydratase PrpD